MKLMAISGVWLLIGLLGMVGLFSNQPGLMGLCLFAWTPLAVGFGYLLRGSGLRVSFGADRAVETVQSLPRESLNNRRERKIT